MDKRFFLALLLTAIVIVAPPLFLNRGARRPAAIADSTSRTPPRFDSSATAAPSTSAGTSTTTPGVAPSTPAGPALPTTSVETTDRSNASLALRVQLPGSCSRLGRPSTAIRHGRPTSQDPKVTRREPREPSELLPARIPLARYRLALGRDTIALDTVALRTEVKESPAGTQVSYTGTVGGRSLALDYAVVPDSFLLHVNANVTGAPAGSALLIGLPRTLRSNEPDTLDDIGHLAVSYRLGSGDIESVGFSKLDSTTTRAETRPTQWIATRNKYFLVAYRAPPRHRSAPYSSEVGIGATRSPMT
jgi:hypothetical protein